MLVKSFRQLQGWQRPAPQAWRVVRLETRPAGKEEKSRAGMGSLAHRCSRQWLSISEKEEIAAENGGVRTVIDKSGYGVGIHERALDTGAGQFIIRDAVRVARARRIPDGDITPFPFHPVVVEFHVKIARGNVRAVNDHQLTA